jgi:serine/threonine protein kinase
MTAALKIIEKKQLEEGHDERLLQEIDIMRHLDHPYIVSFYELIESPSNYLISMEYLEKGTLLDYVNRNGGLGEAEARRIFCQIVSALDYMHTEKHVAHRDIKAENVLLDEASNVRLIDFGFSRVFRQDMMSTCCGSPAYAPPEIISRQPYTAAADIWSLGVLLYAMVVAELPFGTENPQKMIHDISFVDPTYPASLTDECRILLKAMLEKDPLDRISLSEIKMHPWVGEASFLSSERLHELLQNLQGEVLNELGLLNIPTSGINEVLKKNQNDGRAVAYRILRRKVLQAKVRNQGLELSEAMAMRPVARRDSFARYVERPYAGRPVSRTEPECVLQHSSALKPRPVPTRRRKYSTPNHNLKSPL